MSTSAEIILVHGLWFGSWALRPMARFLGSTGLPVRRFGYRTTRSGLESHADRLKAFIEDSPAPASHIVAHSLGGLVTLNLFNRYPELRRGRIVLLGSPLKGSVVARRASRIPGGSALLGEAQKTLWKGYSRLDEGHETGMVAGTRSIGLGHLVGIGRQPGDGTVLLSETRVDGLADHIELPVTHTGLIFSRKVARQARHFIRNGRFDRGPGLTEDGRNQVK